MRGITSILLDYLGQTPARTHRPSGTVWINRELFNYSGSIKDEKHFMQLCEMPGISPINAEAWYFILKHEEGHINLRTTSELAADAYASRQYFAKYGKKPSKSVKALFDILPGNTEEQRQRIAAQLKRAAQYDCAVNGNQKMCEMVGVNKSDFSGDVWLYQNEYSRFNPFPPYNGIGISDYTDCNKFILKKRRSNCLAMNQLERDAEMEKSRVQAEAQMYAMGQQTKMTELQLNALNTPASGGFNFLPLILIAAAGAVVYFLFIKTDS